MPPAAADSSLVPSSILDLLLFQVEPRAGRLCCFSRTLFALAAHDDDPSWFKVDKRDQIVVLFRGDSPLALRH